MVGQNSVDWQQKNYEEVVQANARGFIFFEDQIALDDEQGRSEFPIQNLTQQIWVEADKYYLGQVDNRPFFALELKDKLVCPERNFMAIRTFLETQKQELAQLILKAIQLLNWSKISVYCGACGHLTHHSETETAKICQHCKRILYPCMSPAVSVLVTRGNELLLARSPHFRKGVYSVLAGFINPGESAEEAIDREIFEEVGIVVKNIRYFGTQSWPFPNSFMMGYCAEYDSGELKLCPKEIEDAQWFSLNRLPLLPYKATLSRKLIDHYLNSQNKSL